MNVVYVKHGLASTYGDRIEINELLKACPRLHDKILLHEIKHVRKEKHVDSDEPFDKELFWFILKHPSTWSHFAPFTITTTSAGWKVTYSKTMLLFWLTQIAICLLFGLGAVVMFS